MTIKDLDQVLRIEEQCFTNGWSRTSFESSLASDACRFFVEEDKGRILGYAGIYLAPDEAELFTIACAPEEQKKGIASSLMDAILHVLDENGLQKLFLEVRSSNEAAKKLYEKYGFHEIGIRKEYYQNPTEDAVLMER